MNKGYVLKNPRRFCFVIMLLTMLITCTLFISIVNGADSGPSYINVTVEKGDTLWDLAKEYNKGGDIRMFIHQVRELNDLSGSVIIEGDVIKIPV